MPVKQDLVDSVKISEWTDSILNSKALSLRDINFDKISLPTISQIDKSCHKFGYTIINQLSIHLSAIVNSMYVGHIQDNLEIDNSVINNLSYQFYVCILLYRDLRLNPESPITSFHTEDLFNINLKTHFYVSFSHQDTVIIKAVKTLEKKGANVKIDINEPTTQDEDVISDS